MFRCPTPFVVAVLVFSGTGHASAQSFLCSVAATVSGTNSTACGSQSIVTGDYGMASGFISSVTGNNSSAYGAYSLAGGNNAVAIGAHATAANAWPYAGVSNATALGAYSTAGVGATAAGASAVATGIDASAFGRNASATAANSVALGSGSIAGVANTVSVGSLGSERRIVNVAAGTLSSSSTDAVNGGQLYGLSNTVATNSSDILANSAAITLVNGRFAVASQQVATSLGGGASVDANGYVSAPTYNVLGSNYNNVAGAISALNARVQTNSLVIATIGAGGAGGMIVQDPVTKDILVGPAAQGTTLNIAGVDGPRRLTGVASGTLSSTSSDAVTGSQLYATNTALADQANRFSTTTTNVATYFGGGAQVSPNGTFVGPSYTVLGSSYSNVGDAIHAMDVALASSQTQIVQNTNAISQINSNTTNNPTQRLRYASLNGSGRDSSATGTNAIAFGSGSNSAGAASIAIGSESVASRDNSVAVGNAARATGVNAIAIGAGALATGSVAIGVGSSAANGGAAIGDYAVATGTDSAALGPKSTALARNSVAIGAGSLATEENIVSVGAAGAERRITNVAAGINPTDAVNMSQLNDLNSRFSSTIARVDADLTKIRGGVAMAMAMGAPPLPSDAKVGVSVSVGSYGGQTALGISHAYRLNRVVVLSSSIGLQDRQIGGRASVMAAW